MSSSSAPPANTILDNSNTNNNSKNNTGNSKSIPKTMKQYKEEDTALEREQRDIEKQIKAGESNVIDGLADTAFDLLKQGRAQDALLLYRQSLEKMTKTRGEDHPETLTMIHGVGCALGMLNRHEESLAMFQKTLEKRLVVLGENDLLTLTTMANLADQLACLKRYVESLDLNEKVFEKRSRIQGDEHPDTLNALINIALTLYSVGRDDEAH
jgi:tetratricopeptide (TPR) repeat protein